MDKLFLCKRKSLNWIILPTIWLLVTFSFREPLIEVSLFTKHEEMEILEIFFNSFMSSVHFFGFPVVIIAFNWISFNDKEESITTQLHTFCSTLTGLNQHWTHLGAVRVIYKSAFFIIVVRTRDFSINTENEKVANLSNFSAGHVSGIYHIVYHQ